MSKIIWIVIFCMLGLGGCYNAVFPEDQNPEYEVLYEDSIQNDYDSETGEVVCVEVDTDNNEENTQPDEQLIDAQLLVKYPDTYGWMEKCDYGDIPYLANAAYIDKSVAEGIFMVSTPEELASFNYYVNTTQDAVEYMQLVNDIDLAGYEWAPMGWYDGEGTDMDFNGGIYGEEYTIRNLYIENDQNSVGLIGWGVFCGVWNLTLENAYVEGRSDVGILTGQAIQGWYENCHVSGEVYGNNAGSLHGYSSTDDIFDCTADVMVNGEEFQYLTWNEKERSEIVIENPLVIVLHDDYTVTRTDGVEYTNLSWQIKKDGVVVLERSASNELSYCYTDQSPGVYSICLIAFVEGQYVPVSNVVEYTITSE